MVKYILIFEWRVLSGNIVFVKHLVTTFIVN